jgi:stage II sporulation protein AA (anti-sigma F factor antagonist)
MELKTTKQDDIAVITVSGMIDTRGAMKLEREINTHFEASIRRFVTDLAEVELITSAGIRVLVMLVKRLAGTGGLVLTGMNENVRAVFDIAGLLTQFTICATPDEAITRLRTAAAAAPAVPQKSKVSRAAHLLLSTDGVESGEFAAGPSSSGAPSTLTVEVAQLLARRADPAR